MFENKEEIRYLLKYYFYKKEKAGKAAKKICSVYGKNAVSTRSAQVWFRRFQVGNFDIELPKKSGKTDVENVERIVKKFEKDRHINSNNLAKELYISHHNISKLLKQVKYNKVFDVWVPSEVSPKTLIERINTCEFLLKQNENDPFLKRLITGDEKWIMCESVLKRKEPSKNKSSGDVAMVEESPGEVAMAEESPGDVAMTEESPGDVAMTEESPGEAAKTDEILVEVVKTEIISRKRLLRVWWDYKGIIHYELSLARQKISPDIFYCHQLERLHQAVKRNRPELINEQVLFQHDNNRVHTSLEMRHKLSELGWQLMMHPSYSPDLSPTDYHLFYKLQKTLEGVKFTSGEGCEHHLNQFFSQKPKEFYEDAIMGLPQRWQKVIEKNGVYLNEEESFV